MIESIYIKTSDHDQHKAYAKSHEDHSGSQFMKKTVKVQNKLGIHARPAAEFVKLASKFKSDVFIAKNNSKVNGKSIMGVITLIAEYDSEVEITVNGIDEEEAMTALIELFNQKFYEE